MRRKQKKQGRRLRPLWGALAAMSFLLTLGAAGGMEHGTMALGQGVWLMAASLGAGTAFAKLAGLSLCYRHQAGGRKLHHQPGG